MKPELLDQIRRHTGTDEQARYQRVDALLGAAGHAADRFRPAFLATTAENLFYWKTTKDLVRLLESNGVRVMPLKGVCFARRYYPHLGSRHQSDIDVLVPEADLVKAHARLLASGWTEAWPRAFYQDHYHWVYRREGTLAEVHWRLKWRGTVSPDLERFWNDARTVEIDGFAFREPAREDLLLYIATNKAMQHFGTLSDVVDIAVLLEQDLDWEKLIRNSAADGLNAVLWFALMQAKIWLGSSVPEAVLSRLARPAYTRPARWLHRWTTRRGGPFALSPALVFGPVGRLMEACLEGRPAAIAHLFRPLVIPSRGRVETLAKGSYLRYGWEMARRLAAQSRLLMGERAVAPGVLPRALQGQTADGTR